MVNGKIIDQPLLDKDGYWVIERVWGKKNVITLQFSLHVYVEHLIGSKQYIALLYGPYVLAGRLGKENLPVTFLGKMNNTAMNKIDLDKVPTWKIPIEQIPAYVEPNSGDALSFRIKLEGFENMVLEPFYKIHFERYAVYWPVKFTGLN